MFYLEKDKNQGPKGSITFGVNIDILFKKTTILSLVAYHKLQITEIQLSMYLRSSTELT